MTPVECLVRRCFAQVWGEVTYLRLMVEASFGVQVKYNYLNVTPYIWSHRDNLLRHNHKKYVQRLMQATECRSFQFDRMKRRYLSTAGVSHVLHCPHQKNKGQQMERGMNGWFSTKPLVWKMSGKMTFDHVECNVAHSYLNRFKSCPVYIVQTADWPFGPAHLQISGLEKQNPLLKYNAWK